MSKWTFLGDIKKAFDIVHHEVLLPKLNKWLKSYSTVRLGSYDWRILSRPVKIKYGVPLGHLYFICGVEIIYQ